MNTLSVLSLLNLVASSDSAHACELIPVDGNDLFRIDLGRCYFQPGIDSKTWKLEKLNPTQYRLTAPQVVLPITRSGVPRFLVFMLGKQITWATVLSRIFWQQVYPGYEITLTDVSLTMTGDASINPELDNLLAGPRLLGLEITHAA